MSEQTFSVVPPNAFAYIGFNRRYTPFIPKGGNGYFSSSFPDYLIIVEGRPSVGEIRVLLRTATVPQGDGVLVAKTMSDNTGQWRIDGLNLSYRYDVVCRVEGYNDIIFSNVKPKV
ncbi:hypothetical protein [Acinetobacter sp. CIP 102129]|uniref:hypothetical protein n=1 Tax=Acinetobacter sp. CIP 102129 TaxID=1144664 RepID=UPI0002CEBBE0|nr:hypothetical protein [Acinetobacter sp. CIP 102129]ENU86125.1 hypothetical protein F973_01722 [Acinetobacter sp. CIP 102129]